MPIDNRNTIVGLNALRFLAYLSVFFYHCQPSFIYGKHGVELFFILSSFLLTLLALQEFETTGRFSKLNFFVRRSLRIYPLYYLLVLVSFFVLPFLAKLANESLSLPSNKWLFIFFLSNYENTQTFFPLHFFWSIAVEEQYYLCFLVFSYFFSKNLWIVIGILFSVFFIYFILNKNQPWLLNYSLWIHFINFGMGSLLALLWHKKKLPSIKIVTLCFTLFFGLLAISIENKLLFKLFLACWFASTILIITYLANLQLIYKNYIFKALEYIGKYTYGLYMYSGFVLLFGFKFLSHVNPYLTILILFCMNVLLAVTSYHIFEIWFLKAKQKFRQAA